MTCFDPQLVDWRNSVVRAQSLDWCTAKTWLLEHMPEFDLHLVAGEGDCTKTREELRRELEIGLRRI